ncbi:hypothetical protein B4949_17620 [Vibrio cholerae]|nr:hypothetical protein [Vibrio cholerae]
MLVQFCVQFAAFLYAGSESALGYISISGTIVSIILALLAIIYSYYQSTSQVNSSSSLNSQIGKLIEIVDKIKTNKDDFGSELAHLAEIRDKIESSISMQRLSHEKVEQLSESISQLRENELAGKYPDSGEKDDFFRRLVIEGDNSTHITLLILFYSIQYGVKFQDIWENLIYPTVLSLHKNATPELLQFYKGAIFSTINLLAALEYIEKSRESLPLVASDYFEEELYGFNEFLKSREEEPYKTIISALDKQVGNL